LRGTEGVELVLVFPPPKTEFAVVAVAAPCKLESLSFPPADDGTPRVTTMLLTCRTCIQLWRQRDRQIYLQGTVHVESWEVGESAMVRL
jgi:hypothetical protein